MNFSPAISNKAAKKSDKIREWRIDKRTDMSLEECAEIMNPVARGWINYYGAYYISACARSVAIY